MTEQEAYRRFNREQRMLQQWRRKLRAIALDIEAIELDMEAAFAVGDASVTRSLRENPRYAKTVDAFLRCRGYSKNMDGWRLACGSDVGLFKRTRKLGWDRLRRILLAVNRRST